MKSTKKRMALAFFMISMILLHVNTSLGARDLIESNLINDPYKDMEIIEMDLNDQINLDGELDRKEAASLFNRLFGLTEKTNLSDFTDLIDSDLFFDKDRHYSL